MEIGLIDINKLISILENIEKYIDQTLLKYDVPLKNYEDFVNKSSKYRFRSLVVPSVYVKYVSEISSLPVCGVVGFPYGYYPLDIKLREIEHVANSNAKEVDVVANINYIKTHNWDNVKNELNKLISRAHELGLIIKIIIETSVLSDDEIITVSKFISELNGDFVKTNSGYGVRGASLKDVVLIKSAIKGNTRIKAAGGIRDSITASTFILYGADVIGTSSGIQIVEDSKKMLEIIKQVYGNI